MYFFLLAKCKFMLVSRTKQHTDQAPSISVYGSLLESTTTLKYLGLTIASDLSWSTHIDNVCSKAQCIMGLVHRCFYTEPLRHEDFASVWSPHLQKDIATLEKTQYFAARICTKNWNTGYYDLLDIFELPPFAQRRLHTRLCFVYKIVHGLLYFPPNVVLPLSHIPLRTNHLHELTSFFVYLVIGYTLY